MLFLFRSEPTRCNFDLINVLQVKLTPSQLAHRPADDECSRTERSRHKWPVCCCTSNRMKVGSVIDNFLDEDCNNVISSSRSWKRSYYGLWLHTVMLFREKCKYFAEIEHVVIDDNLSTRKTAVRTQKRAKLKFVQTISSVWLSYRRPYWTINNPGESLIEQVCLFAGSVLYFVLHKQYI